MRIYHCFVLKDSQHLIGVLTLLLFFNINSTYSQNNEYNILDYGAIPDGTTLNTSYIQDAIDDALKNGGGKIIIPKGSFLSGSVVLKSGVEIYLEKGAVLKGSTDPNNYIKINRWKALIMADSSHSISISGKGTIDGQGDILALKIDSMFYEGMIDSSNYNFNEKRPKVTIRPQIIEFVNSENINIKDVTIKNAASWVQSYYRCKNLTIDNIKVHSDTYWNNDGIDIIDCKNVTIKNCFINSSDDGICIKSYGRKWHGSPYCDSITIENCTVRSSASAIKLGTSSFGGFKNITIKNIKVFDTFRSAIALESYGNGFLQNILIENINAKNTGNAFFIRIGKARDYMKEGTLSDITIRNMKVKIAKGIPDRKYKIRGPALPFFHNTFPSSITGLKNQKVENITLENILIIYPNDGVKAYANKPLNRLNDVPEYPSKYPEYSMFGELPSWGIYCRHLNNIKMTNISLKLRGTDYRPAVVFDDVNKYQLEETKIKGNNTNEAIIYHNSLK